MQTIETTYALHALDRDGIDRLIRAFWHLRLQDAPAAIRRYAAPDVVFRILGNPGGGNGYSVFEGQDAVIESVRFIDTNLEFIGFEIVDLIVDGPRAALRWQAALRHRGTGVIGDLAVLDLITVDNGRITQYVEFFDTDGFQQLMAGHPQSCFARKSNTTRAHLKPMNAGESVASPDAAAFALRDAHEDMLRMFWVRRIEDGQAAVTAHFTDDCELHLVGDPTLIPFARLHLGIEAVRALVGQIDMEFELMNLAIREVVVEGDRAAVQWEGEVRHRGTCARGHIQSFDHVVLENGRIRSLTQFFDTAATASWIAG
jgi:ketosteroid isomerase-like protein